MKPTTLIFCILILILASNRANADEQPPFIQIEKTHMSIQGHYEYISIFAHVGADTVTSFDLAIAFQPDALKFIEVQSWARDLRYWKLNPAELEDTVNTGFIRISGYPIPACRDSTGKTYLAEVQFLVTATREFECGTLPIRFVWTECGNNIVSLNDDKQIVAAKVLDWSWDGDTKSSRGDITGNDCNVDWFAHYAGVCDLCESTSAASNTLSGAFWNGVVDVACHSDPRRVGDINQNGVENEIADVESLAAGLLLGIDSLNLPDSLLGEVIDTNDDCAAATIADLVYMVRIMTGDAYPFSMLAPQRAELCAKPEPRIPYPWHNWIRKKTPTPSLLPIPHVIYDSVLVEIRNGTLEINSDKNLAGIFAVFDFAEQELRDSLRCLQPMQLEYRVNDGELRVLLWSGLENLTRHIPAGRHALFAVPKGANLKFLQASDYNGSLLDVIRVTDSGQVRLPLVRQ